MPGLGCVCFLLFHLTWGLEKIHKVRPVSVSHFHSFRIPNILPQLQPHQQPDSVPYSKPDLSQACLAFLLLASPTFLFRCNLTAQVFDPQDLLGHTLPPPTENHRLQNGECLASSLAAQGPLPQDVVCVLLGLPPPRLLYGSQRLDQTCQHCHCADELLPLGSAVPVA